MIGIAIDNIIAMYLSDGEIIGIILSLVAVAVLIVIANRSDR